jgi:hypothetical protein
MAWEYRFFSELSASERDPPPWLHQNWNGPPDIPWNATLHDALTKMGDEDWQLVAITPAAVDAKTRFFFKRERRDGVPRAAAAAKRAGREAEEKAPPTPDLDAFKGTKPPRRNPQKRKNDIS